ncbi:MAG: hypothetical protein RDV48_00810 [Candidatus Eremiobacteraeota bacterium]|nr:hypothetical protein [Candidatus Eremiobacteraeota bacterium]
MSIVPLVKVTIIGLLSEKEAVMADLQELGCIHIISAKTPGETGSSAAVSADARRALAFLTSCPHRRTQVHASKVFDAEKIKMRAIEVEERLLSLRDERDRLQDKIKNLKPWGDFSFPSPEAMRNLKLWFYLVPRHLREKVEASGLAWALVNSGEHMDYFVVVSEKEPVGMPVARSLTGNRSLTDLEQRLIDVENEIEDLEAERYSMTRWCELYSKNLNRLEDIEELRRAYQKTLDISPLFALEGWAPRSSAGSLKAYSEEHNAAIEIREPDRSETPPTLLHNPPLLAGGQDLLTFYITPGYWLSDPSIIIFFSFVIFFSMILADAGYALFLGLGLLLIEGQMGKTESGRRLRVLFFAIVVTSAIWGVMIGSYFGMEPEKSSFLARLKILDLNDYNTMMTICISMGACHVMLANLMDILRKGWKAAALAPLGWILFIGGGLMLGLTGSVKPLEGKCGVCLMAAGLLAVFLFSGVGHPLGARLLHGLERLTKVTSAFGDVMSYLRIFALGLASASLAVAFNNLARQASHAIPEVGIGMLLSLFVILTGHSVNLVLGIMGGVVHGLRLNVIEFLNWSTPEEGYPFRAFTRKGDT